MNNPSPSQEARALLAIECLSRDAEEIRDNRPALIDSRRALRAIDKALRTPAPSPAQEPVCAACKGLRADLARGRDPEELCDPCYDDVEASDRPSSLVLGEGEVEPDVVEYVQRYGGKCRDCADENGFCPTTGIACGEKAKAIRHVIKALRYGVSHGFITSPLSTHPDQAIVEALEQIVEGNFNCSPHQRFMAAQGVAERALSRLKPLDPKGDRK